MERIPYDARFTLYRWAKPRHCRWHAVVGPVCSIAKLAAYVYTYRTGRQYRVPDRGAERFHSSRRIYACASRVLRSCRPPCRSSNHFDFKRTTQLVNFQVSITIHLSFNYMHIPARVHWTVNSKFSLRRVYTASRPSTTILAASRSRHKGQHLLCSIHVWKHV